MSSFRETFAALITAGTLAAGCAGGPSVRPAAERSPDEREVCANEKVAFERDVRNYGRKNPGKLEKLEELYSEVQGLRGLVETYEDAIANEKNPKELKKLKRNLKKAQEDLNAKEMDEVLESSDLSQNSYPSLYSRYNKIKDKCDKYGNWIHPHFDYVR